MKSFEQLMSEEEQKHQERLAYARITGDEGLKERLNNYEWLDVSLWSQTPEMDHLVHEVATMLPTKSNKKRLAHIRVILANLLMKTSADQYIAYYRKHKPYSDRPARYNPAGISRLTIGVVDDLLSVGLVEHHQGQYSVRHDMGYVSKFRPTEPLMDHMESAGVGPEMISRHPDSEVVVLKSAKETAWTGELTRSKGKLMDYKDNPDIEGMRAEIMAYNEFLRGHDIQVPGLPKHEFTGVYRVFNNGSLEQGGRFTGGWWMGLNENVRKGIEIDHRPTIELDFGACMLTLLYALNGLEPVGGGDLYALDGFDRDIVKKASMRCLNNRGRHHAVKGLENDLLKDYPETAHAIDCDCLITAFERKHQVVSHDFFRGIGASDLLYLESEICCQILMTLTDEGICCLSIHDSFIVQAEYKERLWKAMVEAFRDKMEVSYTPVIK